MISRFISSAREAVESATQMSIVRQQRRLYLDVFSEATLPFGPVQSISQVQYIDADGVTQTLSTSIYELSPKEDRILLSYNQSWPSTQGGRNEVWVDYWSGFFDDSVSPLDILGTIPEDIKMAMFLAIGDMYKLRESQTMSKPHQNKAFDEAINPYRAYVQ